MSIRGETGRNIYSLDHRTFPPELLLGNGNIDGQNKSSRGYVLCYAYIHAELAVLIT